MIVEGSALTKTFVSHHLKLRSTERGRGGSPQKLEDKQGKDYEKPLLDSNL